jgi:hypothetical protein
VLVRNDHFLFVHGSIPSSEQFKNMLNMNGNRPDKQVPVV